MLTSPPSMFPLLRLFTDGGSRGNPGPAAAGVALSTDDVTIHLAGYFLGRATNNVAEYMGLIRGLEVAARLKPDRLEIFCDSQLMVRQIQGDYRVKSADLKPLYERAIALLKQFAHWEIEHVYRQHNSQADEIANQAMDRRRDVIAMDGLQFVAGRQSGDAPPPATPQPPTSEARDTDSAEASAKSRGFTPPPPAVVAWMAEFAAGAGEDCPAPVPKGATFRFAQMMPAGICVHAAKALLADLPTHDRNTPWQVRCACCGAAITCRTIKPGA